jgi:hypothetical protein
MTRSLIQGDCYVNGTLMSSVLVPSSGCISDSHIGSAANLDPAKARRRFRAKYSTDGVPTSVTIPLHVVQSANGATAISIVAGVIVVPTGDYTITVDLLKNGTTILSAAVVLSSSSTEYTVQAGTITGATLAVDDWLDVDITVAGSSGTQGEGLFVCCEIEEAMV